jgi:hypothetical protein
MGKRTPRAPDYAGAAAEQAESSERIARDTTWADRPNQHTPWGSQTWQSQAVRDPATGQMTNQWTSNLNLTPEAQGALDSQMRVQQGLSSTAEGMLGRVGQETANPMDWSGFQQISGAPGTPDYSPENIQRGVDTAGPDLDPSQRYHQQAGDAIYNQWADRALPQQERDTSGLQNRLYAMGLREGDEAFNREMDRMRESQGDARQQASYQATIGAGQEAARMHGMDSSTRGQLFGENLQQGAFANQAAQQALAQQLGIGQQQFGQDMAGSQFNNTVRQQQIAEEMQRRGFSLNELNALMHGQQVQQPNMPNFAPATSAQPVQSLAAANMQGQAGLDAFNAQQGAIQGMMGGAASLAGMFSDRRLKRNIQKLGVFKGVQWYIFEYLWGETAIGVMADEVPHAAFPHESGYAMVDYGRL